MSDSHGWIIRRLGALPSAEVIVREGDGSLVLRVGGGPMRRIELLFLGELSAERLLEFVRGTASISTRSPRLLLIDRARYGVRKELADAGVSWAERDSGFLHLDIPPYFIRDSMGAEAYLEDAAQATRRRGARPTRLVGKSGRCAESLILWEQAHRGLPVLEVTPSMLAAIADVSMQLATKVLHRLEKGGAVEGRRSGRLTRSWAIRSPGRILDLWAAEDAREPRTTKAYVWARSPRYLLDALGGINEIADRWALGGVFAANMYAPTLTADPIPSVWIPEDVVVESLVKQLDGKIVGEEGPNIEFRQMPSDPWMLHRIEAARPAGVVRNTAVHENDAGVLLAALEPAKVRPPLLAQQPSLSLVSPVRAYVEASNDSRGRAADVAEALRRTFAFE